MTESEQLAPRKEDFLFWRHSGFFIQGLRHLAFRIAWPSEAQGLRGIGVPSHSRHIKIALIQASLSTNPVGKSAAEGLDPYPETPPTQLRICP